MQGATRLARSDPSRKLGSGETHLTRADQRAYHGQQEERVTLAAAIRATRTSALTRLPVYSVTGSV
jgi:hypothetical protein